jgi:hypothetical protein
LDVKRRAAVTATPAATNATSGAIPAGMMTLDTSPLHRIECPPAWTSIAPITPPIRAWLELEGIAKYHVVTFQQIAPTSPAKMTGNVTRSCATRALAIVAATFSDRNAPTRFSTEQRATAVRGLRAPVAMVGATAFAVSWNPFVKSNASATTITMSSNTKLCTAPSYQRNQTS